MLVQVGSHSELIAPVTEAVRGKVSFPDHEDGGFTAHCLKAITEGPVCIKVIDILSPEGDTVVCNKPGLQCSDCPFEDLVQPWKKTTKY